MLSPLFFASAQLVHAVFSFAWMLILVRIVLSWVRPNPGPGFVRSVLGALYGLTDPVLHKVRALLPFLVIGGLDLTPIALILGLQFTDTFVTGTLLQLAYG